MRWPGPGILCFSVSGLALPSAALVACGIHNSYNVYCCRINDLKATYNSKRTPLVVSTIVLYLANRVITRKRSVRMRLQMGPSKDVAPDLRHNGGFAAATFLFWGLMGAASGTQATMCRKIHFTSLVWCEVLYTRQLVVS